MDYEKILSRLGDGLSFIFSTLVLSGINIIISGHLLGYLLSLSKTGKTHFTIKIPYIIHLEIKGRSTLAGFAAFGISILLVCIFLSDQANKIFIQNAGATDSQWTAIQALAASISVIVCLSICAIKSFIVTINSWRKRREIKDKEPSEAERVRKLTSN